MEKFFQLKQNGTNVRTEVIAGITTFMTMAYILAVNPDILSKSGMDFNAVFTATALASIVGSVAMAFLGKLPFALAPGMGLNAFFVYVVCFSMGQTWQFALTAVFLEGIIFIILTAFNVREAIVNSIPSSLKKAISVGIGLFIALIGLKGAGLVKANINIPEGSKVSEGLINFLGLGSISEPNAIVCLIGLLVGSVLLARKIKGALLIAIFVSVIVGLFLGVTKIPDNFTFISLPKSIEPIFFKFEFGKIFTFDMLIVLFTFLFVDMFDTIGTLIGVTTKANMLDKDGKVPRVKGALFADAIGTTVGAVLGTSTVTTYVESAAGVEEGGRTGLTALVVAGLFFLALFFSQVFGLVTSAATAPALILVGVFMMSPVKDIDFSDYSELIPAFLCLFMMPMTYSISEGIAFGIVSFILIKVCSGRAKSVPVITYLVGIFFLIHFILKII